MKNGEPVDEHFGSNEVSEMHAAPSANPLSGPRKDARDRAIDQAVEKVRQSRVDYAVWMDSHGEFHTDPASTAPWGSTIAVAHAPSGHLSYKRHGTSEEVRDVEAKRTRRAGPSHTPGMPTVTAVPHHYGNGYAYTYVYNSEEYSSQRREPFDTATAAIKAGKDEVAKKIEWDTVEPLSESRRPPLREHPYPPSARRPMPRRPR